MGRGPQGLVASKLTDRESLDEMDCSEGCRTAAVMFGVPGVRVLASQREPAGLELTVETRMARSSSPGPRREVIASFPS